MSRNESDETIAMQRLANVEHQITLNERGAMFVSCPYCYQVTPEGQEAECCNPMHEAIAAVLHRKMMARQLERADKIAQSVN